MERPIADKYFMDMAKLAATRSTCLRRHVGAVIVKDKHVLSTGYNGAPRGILHCSETGCIRIQLNVPSGTRHELCRGVHAEQNAVAQAAYFGISVKGASIYTTTFPCNLCAKILINAGIREIVYDKGYMDGLSKELLDNSDLIIRRVEADNFRDLESGDEIGERLDTPRLESDRPRAAGARIPTSNKIRGVKYGQRIRAFTNWSGSVVLSRTDILSEIKEAESKADSTVAQAEADKKAAIAQARRDSVRRVQEETARERAAYEAAIAEEQASLDKEKADKLAEGEKEADAIGKSAEGKIKEVSDFLAKEFERAIDASS